MRKRVFNSSLDFASPSSERSEASCVRDVILSIELHCAVQDARCALLGLAESKLLSAQRERLHHLKHFLRLLGVHPVAGIDHGGHLRVGKQRRNPGQLILGGDVVRLAAPDEQRGLQKGRDADGFLAHGGAAARPAPPG